MEENVTQEELSNSIDKESKIVINSVVKLFNDKLSKYTSEQNGMPLTITNIRGIILHRREEYKDAFDCINKMIETNRNPFHFIIDHDGKIYQVNPIDRALDHCYFETYSEKANSYFGDNLCPLSKKEDRNQLSPNICTISICIPTGKITSNVYNSLVRLCAYIINKYSKALQATQNILSMFEVIDTGNTDLNSFKTHPEFYRMFKYDVEKLRSNWLMHFGGLTRGYPSEQISEILEKV